MRYPEAATRPVAAQGLARMSGSDEVRERADSLRSILPGWLNSSHHPIGVVDENGIVAFVNDAASGVFGLGADEVLGRPVFDFIEPSEHETYRSHRHQTTRGEAEPYVLRIGAGEDSRRDFLVLSEVFRDDTGQFQGTIATFLEVATLVTGMRAHLEAAAKPGQDLLERIQPSSDLEQLRVDNEALAGLTQRQWQVTIEIYRGRRVRNVAIDLEVSEHTVRTHLKSVFRKLGIISQSDLIDWIDDQLRANSTD